MLTNSPVGKEISMDFIEGLLKLEGVDSILVMVDCLSKYIHFVGVNHAYTSQIVASNFLKEVVQVY